MLLQKIHQHVIRRVGYFTKALTVAPAPVAEPDGFTVRELDPQTDLRALLDHRHNLAEAIIRERFALGHRCFATLHHESVVHSMWVGFGHARVAYLQRDIMIPPGNVYSYDSWTDPPFRQQGLSKLRSPFMQRCLFDEGIRQLMGLVALHNAAGMANTRAAGYASLGYYLGVKMGPWIKVTAHPDPGQQLPQLR